jgi:hypothetical protein
MKQVRDPNWRTRVTLRRGGIGGWFAYAEGTEHFAITRFFAARKARRVIRLVDRGYQLLPDLQ